VSEILEREINLQINPLNIEADEILNYMNIKRRGYYEMETITEGVLVAIRKIIQASDMHSNSIRRSAGLTSPQLLLLRAIWSHPDTSIGKLSKKISLSQSTVTIILDHLEAEGLAVRYRSDIDRRKVHARLTEKGLLTLEAAPLPLQVHFIEQFENLMEHEQSSLLSSLQKIAAMMDEPNPKEEQTSLE